MALDLNQLRTLAKGGQSAPFGDDFAQVLAADSLLEIVRYLKLPGKSSANALVRVKASPYAIFTWGVLYAALGIVAIVMAALAVLLVFGFSTDTPRWSRLIKLPLMLFGAYASIFVVPIAAIALAGAILFSCAYLLWGSTGQAYRAAATVWCFVPGVTSGLVGNYARR